jgi:quinol monooxygenase YgiN
VPRILGLPGDRRSQGAFLLYERYTSEDAFQAHRRTPHFENIIELQVVPLLDERVWTRMEPLPNGPG